MGIHAYNTYNIPMYTLWICTLNLHKHHTAECIACTYYILYVYICSSYCIIINAEHGVPSGDYNLDIQLQSISHNLFLKEVVYRLTSLAK